MNSKILWKAHMCVCVCTHTQPGHMLAFSTHVEANGDGKWIENRETEKTKKKIDLSKLGGIPTVQRGSSGTYNE